MIEKYKFVFQYIIDYRQDVATAGVIDSSAQLTSQKSAGTTQSQQKKPDSVIPTSQQLICNVCRYKFTDSKSYQEHLRTKEHALRNNNQYRCSLCLEEFETDRQFIFHGAGEAHILVKKLLSFKTPVDACNTCNVKFRDLKSFGEHLIDSEHMVVMALHGTIACALCGWSNLSTDVVWNRKKYQEHIEIAQHIPFIQRLHAVFETAENL